MSESREMTLQVTTPEGGFNVARNWDCWKTADEFGQRSQFPHYYAGIPPQRECAPFVFPSTQTLFNTQGKPMKTTIALFALLFLFATGCKKDSANPISTPVPSQPNVTFTMHMESGTQGMIFVATTGADVKLTKVIIRYPAENFTDTVTNPNPETVILKNSNIQLNEYTGINTHQQWVLVFHGSLASTGEAFVVTVNWDVV
jgi:hypothetical protein